MWRTNSPTKASGAVSLFGEKYDAQVRVLSVPSGSRELCGGTHCRRTGDIGALRITSEAGIAAGVRRIEAVTGLGAVEAAARDRAVLGGLCALLKAQPGELEARVEALLEEQRAQRKERERRAREAGLEAARALGAGAEDLGGLKVLLAAQRGLDAKGLKGLADSLAGQGLEVLVLAGEQDGRAPLLVRVGPQALARGVNARVLLEALTGLLGGGGGGSPAQAQGQGQKPAALEPALAAARAVLEQALAPAAPGQA